MCYKADTPRAYAITVEVTGLRQLLLLPSAGFSSKRDARWPRVGPRKSSCAPGSWRRGRGRTGASHRTKHLDMWVHRVTRNGRRWRLMPGALAGNSFSQGVFLLFGGGIFAFQRPGKHVTNFPLMSQSFFFIVQLEA